MDVGATSTWTSRSHSTATMRQPALSRCLRYSGEGQTERASRIHSIFFMERLLEDPLAQGSIEAHLTASNTGQFLCRVLASRRLLRIGRLARDKEGDRIGETSVRGMDCCVGGHGLTFRTRGFSLSAAYDCAVLPAHPQFPATTSLGRPSPPILAVSNASGS